MAHSPLVGASSWLPTARCLERLGYACEVPSPTGLPPWREWASAVAALVQRRGDDVVVVGHSAAGLLLPAIADAHSAAVLVFVDARIPPETGTAAPADDEFMGFLRRLADRAGVLPPWSHWWGEGIIDALIPDIAVRRVFEADLPRLPLAWFDDTADVPRWQQRPSAYVQLSALYASEADQACSRGWPVEQLDGTHVHAVTHPDAVAAAIHATIERIQGPSG